MASPGPEPTHHEHHGNIKGKHLHQRRKVMLCFDNSKNSVELFEWAVQNIFQKENDHVIIATVFPDTDGAILGSFLSVKNLSDLTNQTSGEPEDLVRKHKAAKEAANSKLQVLAAKLNEKHITTQIMLLNGDAKTLLVKAAQDVKADLVLVASRGFGVFKRAVLGSVSNYLVHELNVPVLIMKTQSSVADH
jgi:nucleotide-binding universal stress UspA family protein